MPLIHEKLPLHKVEKVIKNRKFGFCRHQGGWMQLTKPSATEARQDGSPIYKPLPGMISPVVLERILKYAENLDEAANQIIAIATGKLTDPVLQNEPSRGGQGMDLDAVTHVAKSIAENEFAEAIADIRRENKKQVDEMRAEIERLRQENESARQESAKAGKPMHWKTRQRLEREKAHLDKVKQAEQQSGEPLMPGQRTAAGDDSEPVVAGTGAPPEPPRAVDLDADV